MLGHAIAADLHREWIGSGARQRTPAYATAPLSKRERQIVALLGEGLSNAQLAQRCFISEGTVKWYLHHLYTKVGVANRTALLSAVRSGRGFSP